MPSIIPDERSPSAGQTQNLFPVPAVSCADTALVSPVVRGAPVTVALRTSCHPVAMVLLAFVAFGPSIIVPSYASSAVLTTASSTSVRTRTGATYSDFIAEAAQRFALPVQWIRAVMDVESAKQPHAVSSRGALGLMQLMPATWRLVREQLGLGSDPFDPHDNVIAGAAYLRQMWDRYGMPGALAAYNAGPGRWESYLAGTRPLPTETIAYVASLASRIGTAALPMMSATRASRRYEANSGTIFVAIQSVQPSTPQRTNVPDTVASGAIGAARRRQSQCVVCEQFNARNYQSDDASECNGWRAVCKPFGVVSAANAFRPSSMISGRFYRVMAQTFAELSVTRLNTSGSHSWRAR